MRNKRKYFILVALALLLAFMLGMSPTTQAQSSVAFSESFDNGSMFTTSTAFFSDGGGDYFGISDGAGGGDFGTGAAPSALKGYTGLTGSFLTGMDLDGEGATLPITVNWTSININGMTALEFSGDFAEYFDDPGDIDDLDSIKVEYQIDGGGYQNLIWFSGADFTSSGIYNGNFREDTDFDGVGDGVVLGNAAQTFTKPIADTGATLDLRLTVSVNSGDEDFAVDNFAINGEGGAPPVDPGQALPLVEDFDVCTLDGWEIVSVDADAANTWACNETYSNIEANGYGDAAPADEWLITPALNLDAQENDTLTFRSFTDFSDAVYPTLAVLYSENYDGGGDPTSATWTELSGFTLSAEDSGIWTDSGEVDLSGISGTNVYVAFHYTSTGTGGGSAATWRLDGVNIFEGDDTPPPSGSAALVISGVIDGPLSGGVPKAIEFFAISDIADLSEYGFGSANNGDGSDGQEYTFPTTAVSAGSFVYVASEAPGFTEFFGFAPDGTSSAAGINGDDAVELFQNGEVIDVFGDINVDGNGQPWEYLDGWAYRVAETGPDGNTFVLGNWTFSGANALDDETSNATAATPFPIGTYFTADPGMSLPLTENFDDCTLADWQIISVDADTGNTWGCNETYSNIEANGYGDTAAADEWLITPALNLNAQDSDTLTFRNYTNYSDSIYPTLSVLYATDYDGSGDPSSATWTELTGINLSAENSGNWVDSGDVDLSGISGLNVHIAFHYTSTGTSGGSAATWRLDSIDISGESIPTGPTAYKIHEIQGDGLASPLVGEEVIIEGVVVGDFQADNQFKGFHVQEEDADADADPATSEGIFVYYFSTDVAVGDVVQVTGSVAEYEDLTELTSVSDVTVVSSGNPLPTTTAVSLPVTTIDDFEAFEGMLVTFPDELTISEFFNYDRYGEVVLSVGRQFQPTAVYEPGSPEAAALAVANQLSRITLDDGSRYQNPDPAIHPNGSVFDLTNTFRGGDTVQNATGIMDYARGTYRVQPTIGADYVAQNLRTSAPDVGGPVTVASFNVLNYFTTFGSRGADDAVEFDRQRTKIFAALADIDADVVGLIEIENNNDVAVADLVTGLNAFIGEDTYDYIATGMIGDDAITTAFIYKPATVSPMGAFAILDDISFTDPNNTGQDKNRPALAQTFVEDETNSAFTVVVNHLKSKGSGCGAGDDDPEQGSCNLTRTLAAQALVDWLATDPTASGDVDYLIMGDLNAYDKEDPIDAILAGADDIAGTADDYTDLSNLYGGEFAYSYVFSGQLGYLDYALANASLLPQITGVATWNINADEPDILDYDMSFKQDAQDALYEPNAYRSSDHDPVIIGLDFGLPRNADGCYVIAAEDTPFVGRAVTVEKRGDVLNGFVWLVQSNLSEMACLEMHGSDSRDLMFAGQGNDSIFGYDGRDYLLGFGGDDVLTGGPNRDIFIGSQGFDTVLDYERREGCHNVEVGCPNSPH